MLVSPTHLICFVALASVVHSMGEPLKVDSYPAETLEDFPFGSPLINNKLQKESMQDHRTLQDSSKGPETLRNDTINDFIIVLHDDLTIDVQREELENLIATFGSNGTKIMYEFKNVFKGFAVSKVTLKLMTEIEGVMGADIDYMTPVS
jgi:hypothetical protein